MASNDNALAAISALLQSGRLADAERLCRESLASGAPGPERFHYALGHIYLARRDLANAAAALREAIAAAPAYEEALHTFSFVLKEQGDHEGALDALRRAASCAGAGAKVYFNLGVMHRERGENRPAVEAFRRAIEVEPGLGAAWNGLGLAYRALNEVDEAIAALKRAVECDPRNGGAHVALGTLLLDLERTGAVEPLSRAAALDPTSATVAERHARALARAGRFDEAFREHERACRLAPGSAACLLSRARTLVEADQPAAAEALWRQIIASPEHSAADKAAAYHELADALLAQGDAAGARLALDLAVPLAPDNSEIRLRRAMLMLSLGEFQPGWSEFEARFGKATDTGGSIRAQPFPQPRWRGQDLSKRTILVWGEQGIGDDIVAASMLSDLAARAGQVWVHTDARLAPLFTRSFPGNVRFFPRIVPIQPELLSAAVSYQVPLGGVGEFLRPTWASFGTPRAFLVADPTRVRDFRARYTTLPGRKIGISWRSGNLVNGRIKSTDLGVWEPILCTPGTTFISLQYGDCATELESAEKRLGIRIHQDRDVDQLRDMDTFAAQVASLDLVLSVSNAVAHTAGSLGVPTWVLLATDPLWIWFRGREDSPWYPNVRLFRQDKPGDWRAPILRVGRALTGDPTVNFGKGTEARP